MFWVKLTGRQRLLWLLPVVLYGSGAWMLAQRDLNIVTLGALFWLVAIGLAGYFLISEAGEASTSKGQTEGDSGRNQKPKNEEDSQSQ